MVSVPVPDPDVGGGRWGPGFTCKHVLVADEARHYVRLIQVNLGRKGIMVSAAYDAAAARAIIDSRGPDVLMVSASMPGSIDLIAAVKGNDGTKDIRIIALTAKPADAETLLLWQRGVDGILLKPFDPNELLWMIQGL